MTSRAEPGATRSRPTSRSSSGCRRSPGRPISRERVTRPRRRANRARARDAGDRRHYRRGSRSDQRRRAGSGRDDADVWLDDLHHPRSGPSACGMRGSGMRRGCFPASTRRMAGLATSGTLTHWFADQLARDLVPRRRWPRWRPRREIAARRQRACCPALFFRRADADPRSARQGRHRRSDVGAHARRHLPRRARGNRFRDQTHLRHLRRGWRAAFDDRRRWRGTSKPDLDASHVRYFGGQAGGAGGQHSAPRTATPFWRGSRSATSADPRSSSGTRRRS